MSVNKFASTCLSAVLAGALCGCAATHKSMEPSVAEEIESLSVVSMIPQDEVHIAVKQSKTGGALFGLIGTLVDAGVTSSRKSHAEDIVLKLRAQMRAQNETFTFRDEFWASLDSLLEESEWPAEVAVARRAEEMDKAELRAFVTENQRDAAVILRTTYFLTPSVTILAITTDAEAYLHNPSERIYFGRYTYLSDRIAADDAKIAKEVAADSWAAQGASEFLQDVREGIAENIKMFRWDLLRRDESVPPDARWVEMEYEDPYGQKDKQKSKALLLARLDGRAFLRGKKGNLFSMPEHWLDAFEDAPKDVVQRK